MKRLLIFLIILSTLIACTDEKVDGYVTYVGSPEGDTPAYFFTGDHYNFATFEPDKADVAKIVGSTIYVLNPYHGFMIMSIGLEGELEINGSFSLPCEPVKMHIEEYRAYIMCNAEHTYSFDEQSLSGTHSISSKLFILNIEFPFNIKPIGSHNFPGTITDFRKTGDMLYIVSRLRGVSTEGMDEGVEIPSRTLITSIDVSDPSNVTDLDQLHFDARIDYVIRTLVTSDRIYVAMPANENDPSYDGISSIQAVDISDPSGELVVGNKVELAGYINKDGQMYEHNGVLRVVSRWSDFVPVVETFTVSDSVSLSPSGSLTMDVALPDELHSVTFDASRVFIVMDESQDTVYSADLSNHAAPVQGSDIEISGDLHKMTFVGDRLLTLSHDSNLDQFNLSMFDVSDLNNAGMVASVNFGSEYSSVFDPKKPWFKWNNFMIQNFFEQNKVAIQFEGWDDSGYKSGIQLFFVDDTTLEINELVSHNGLPRMLFYHDQSMYSVKDEKIDVFRNNFTNSGSSLPLLREIEARVTIPNALEAQLVKDPGSLTYSLEIVNNPEATTPVSSKSLAYLGAINPLYEYWSNNDFSLKMFSIDNYIYLVRGEEPWHTSDESQMPAYKPLRVIVYDVRDPFAPEIVSNTSFNYPHGQIDIVDNTIIIMPLRREWYHPDQAPPVDALVYGIDMSDVTEPVISFEIPNTTDIEYKGFRRKGKLLISYHTEPDSSGSDHEKYFLDRIDFSDYSTPVLLEKINIPGMPVDFNPATGKIITLQNKLRTIETDEATCWQMGFYKSHYEDGQCKYSERTLNFLYLNGTEARINQIMSYDKGYISDVSLTDFRLFVQVSHEYFWVSEEDPRPILYVYDVDAALTYPLAGSVRLPSPYSTLTGASGNSAFITTFYPQTFWTANATNPDNITITQQ
ncbi:beta-propeller domain-containing protein [Myxococcota bacterium]|nr:beta-propeller domain-containing protein [Myxococcota bacterium]MBU1380098.1 beta-propeller domain-containing protein [Myxococcota bacterium]MBU1496096.1 beta-propeller domain-containing protein [Myxococcota bacterium]